MASTVTSTNNLSLRSILEKDKLTGSNFLDWERNLMIVLRHERKWYVLEEPLGEAPPANAPAAARNAHKKHSDDLLDVACLMLATMSPDLQAGLINTNAYDMIRQLRDMFQTQARTERYDATKAFNECKMVKGTSVSDHVMKMKRHLDHLERLGHPVPLQLATDTILNSLSEDYRPFVVNYNMNNMEKTIAELHSMLKTAELNMGNKNKTKDVLMVKDGGVKKKNGHASTSKGKGPVQAIQSAPKKGKGKGKGKKVKPNKARTENRCFICNEIGHWRQNCPKRHEAGRNHSSTQQLRKVAVYIFRNWKLVQRIETVFSTRASGSGNNSQGQSRASTFKDFMACQPSHFVGKKYPIACYRWVAAVEGAFRTCGCPEAMKVVYSVNLIRDAGKDWWGLMLKSRTEEQINAMTWEEFKLDEEFSPCIEKERITAEFMNLKQTTETVNEITAQFLEKSLFCPDYVSSEEVNKYRYRQVLKAEIREFMATAGCKTFNDIVEIARARELYLEQLQQGKRKAEQALVPAKKFKGPPRSDGRRGFKGCSKCGKNHSGECRLPEPVCYKYGKPGHRSRECGIAPKTCFHCFQPCHIKPNCPQLVGATAAAPVTTPVVAPTSSTLRITDGSMGKKSGPSSIGRGRVFQLTAEEAKVEPDVVTGPPGLLYRIPSVRTSSLSVRGAVSPYPESKWGELIVYGEGRKKQLAFCSVAKASKYLRHGCAGYLAYAMTDAAEERELSVAEVPVVSKYPDVFPKDLPGIPPEREVEFGIDLVPGAAPVARTPYRLAPPKLQELSSQLQELSAKGFIRPSSSPWGVPILFVKKKDGSHRMYRLPGAQ
ncbi:hypothetical protein OSB04_013017 [Centaurea solstitialis]|uniref:CCHC-type domain-containing protein n=1 Tax=Centaurea solstitialis TaxID=347529 RepID=A0AA38TCG5_9ASTR|nr:hypothetical protein OSB04_013017 [Centaurea solstitialis]